MPGRYDPDWDVKDTKRMITGGSSHTLWDALVKEPLHPISIYMGISAKGEVGPQIEDTAVREMQVNVCHAQWSRTRGVYEFDPTLAEALDDADVDSLTDAAFTRIPEWCVFIRLNKQVGDLYAHGGFVAHVPVRPNVSLIFTLVVTDPDPNLPIVGGHAAQFSYWGTHFNVFLDDPVKFSSRKTAYPGGVHHDRMTDLNELLLKRAAYLCAEEPEIRNRHSKYKGLTPQRKKNTGPVMQWDVGVRFGETFRRALKAREEEIEREAAAGVYRERARPRPHYRRSHFHTYVYGPRKDPEKQERKLKWLPPTLVNAESAEDGPVVVHKVKG